MENKIFGKNRAVLCGKVVAAPEFDHSITNENDEVVKEYYQLMLEVHFENKKKTVTDDSVLPVLVTKDQIDEAGGIEEGELIFTIAKFRAFPRMEDGKRRTRPKLVATKTPEKVEKLTRTQNKIELHGYLKSKLFKAEFDEQGKLKRDERGKLIPVLEDGKIVPWTRRNAEGLTVNDITLQVPKEVLDEDGEVKVLYEDYIPSIGYGAVAWQIANEIDVKTKVKARGYVRSRQKNGGEPGEMVYEVVVTRITPVTEDEETQEGQE